jgi:hypothetical protein
MPFPGLGTLICSERILRRGRSCDGYRGDYLGPEPSKVVVYCVYSVR